MNGNAIAAMFNIGHSALHGSLFPKTWMNRVAGLIAMAPALKPVTSWIHVHNYLHHSFTNIKEKDASYAPLSPTEYNILPLLENLVIVFAAVGMDVVGYI